MALTCTFRNGSFSQSDKPRILPPPSSRSHLEMLCYLWGIVWFKLLFLNPWVTFLGRGSFSVSSSGNIIFIILLLRLHPVQTLELGHCCCCPEELRHPMNDQVVSFLKWTHILYGHVGLAPSIRPLTRKMQSYRNDYSWSTCWNGLRRRSGMVFALLWAGLYGPSERWCWWWRWHECVWNSRHHTHRSSAHETGRRRNGNGIMIVLSMEWWRWRDWIRIVLSDGQRYLRSPTGRWSLL